MFHIFVLLLFCYAKTYIHAYNRYLSNTYELAEGLDQRRPHQSIRRVAKMSSAYCIYLRKSRTDIEAESRGEGETLARHERILRDLAYKMNLPVTKVYREIVSGETISSRPVMRQLLSEVEQSIWEGVLVVEVERLARGDTVDQGIVAQSFKYSGTKIITPMKIYDPSNEFDEEYFEFGLFMSRREYKTINRRLQRGRIESIKEGKYLGTRPPYGYKRMRLHHDKGYTLDIIPHEASIVTLIYELYNQGDTLEGGALIPYGVSKIASKLNSLKIKAPRGDRWVSSTIRGILNNPVYIGKIRWNARPLVKTMQNGKMVTSRPRAKKAQIILVDGLHKPIISEALYQQVQNRISHHKLVPTPHVHITKNPLSGLIVCGLCGRKMVRRPYSNHYPDALICKEPNCHNISTKLTLVEKRLLEALTQWLVGYAYDYNSHHAIPTVSHLQEDITRQSVTRLEKELDILHGQLDSLHDLLEQGIYTPEDFTKRSLNIKDRIASMEKDRDQLKKLLDTKDHPSHTSYNPLPKTRHIMDMYQHLSTPQNKNLLLRELLQKAVYIKTVNGRWHHSQDDFELHIYPNLPKK